MDELDSRTHTRNDWLHKLHVVSHVPWRLFYEREKYLVENLMLRIGKLTAIEKQHEVERLMSLWKPFESQND